MSRRIRIFWVRTRFLLRISLWPDARFVTKVSRLAKLASSVYQYELDPHTSAVHKIIFSAIENYLAPGTAQIADIRPLPDVDGASNILNEIFNLMGPPPRGASFGERSPIRILRVSHEYGCATVQ
jgi:hypothetical protein